MPRIDLSEDGYKRAMISIFVITLFVQILDGTIVNVAIPTLADAFKVTDVEIDRAIIGYLVGLAVFIPTSSWLADRFGVRKMFLFSLTQFTLASALCGLSQSLDQLLVFRVLQGIGAGIMGPLGAAMLYRAFPQNERAKANTAVISVAVIAPAIGPVIGGLIIETIGWRWIFFVNIPIGIVAFTFGYLIVRDSKVKTTAPFDFVGFALAGVGLGATLFGVTVARDLGWSSLLVITSVSAGAVSLIALPIYEIRHRHPLLRFELFRAPIFRAIQVVTLPTYAAFMGVIFLMPVYLQSLRGFSPFEAGLTVFPQAIGIWISAQIVGRVLYVKVGPRRLLFGGLTATLLIGLALTALSLDTSLWTIRGLMFARGFSLGFVFIAIQTSVYSQTSVEDTAQATALYTANRQSAPAFGIAIAAAVLSSSASAEPLLGDFRLAFAVCAMLFVPAIIAVLWVRDEDAAATLVSKQG